MRAAREDFVRGEAPREARETAFEVPLDDDVLAVEERDGARRDVLVCMVFLRYPCECRASARRAESTPRAALVN
ncbi:MAG: hypothetical protein FJ252_01080 [Phycisphaerae bacterium]|nr:hypothetical protein [Phycisphaerae bacterium]